MTVDVGGSDARLDLYWIPLGAGARVVQTSGRIYEGLAALTQRRPRQDLYHSALVADTADGRYVVEMTPVPDDNGSERGVVGGGAVGSRLLGRPRVFRYELRRWRDGVVPDIAYAVDCPVTNHAITIDAPPEDVWPWMVQMGWGRGGWYTARWVDRLLFCTRRVICRRAGAKPSAPLSTGHGRSC